MLKKNLSILFVLILIIGILAGCKADEEAQAENNQNSSDEPGTEQTDNGAQVEAPKSVTVYQGLGKSVNFRNGPGKDSKGVQVYSLNYVTADATFDAEGRILNVFVDALEVSTPNYDGETMPHFSGWPGTEGYNVTDHTSLEVSGISENTEETIADEVNNWITKRERGDSYGMNYDKDWHKQMDFYQDYFKGMTVAEIEEWFSKYTAANGRPLKDGLEDEADKAKYEALTDQEKAELADVVSGATFSLQDAHGDIIGAIKNAYENRVAVTFDLGESVKGQETATENNGGSSDASVDFSTLVDGDYKVEFDSYDSHGYKPTLELSIANGEVTAISYEEFGEDGSPKSEDETYKEEMLAHSTTYPAESYAALEEQVLNNQSATVDTVSGATASTKTFQALLSYALSEMAANGTTSGTIPLQ